jgi:hypothetical protein
MQTVAIPQRTYLRLQIPKVQLVNEGGTPTSVSCNAVEGYGGLAHYERVSPKFQTDEHTFDITISGIILFSLHAWSTRRV